MELAVAHLDRLPAPVRDQRIMALCDQAIGSLGEARSLEEVLGIKNVAEAFETYSRKLRASHEAQTACTQVTLLAEAKIGSELKAAQDRGEIGVNGGDRRSISVQTSDAGPAAFEEIGIPRQRAAEYKALAAAGPEAIREEVQAATAEGRRPSRGSGSSGTESAFQADFALLGSRPGERCRSTSANRP